MLTLLALTLAQWSQVPVAVVDVSAPDAAWEDTTRAMADQVVEELARAGVTAARIDERELPEGCKLGPCLGQAAREHKAKLIVALDAEELDKHRMGVALYALAARDGRPIAATRYVVKDGKTPKERAGFVGEVAKEVKRIAEALAKLEASDAGRDAGAAK